MALSSDLISQFAKITKDETKNVTESVIYGTVKENTNYVQIDGSDVLTPVTTTVVAQPNDRVMIEIKNHTAVITGNISNKAARAVDVISADRLVAAEAQIDILTTANATVQNTLTAHNADIGTLQANDVTIQNTLNSQTANISSLQSDNVIVNNRISANEAAIETLQANSVTTENLQATYATIANLNAANADINELESDLANFETASANNFTAVNASISNLETNKLSAESADIRYANIDFSNITESTMANFYAGSGLIQNATINNSVITGELKGVTIRGDRIITNSLQADKLVILGDDGLYYKLNTTGVATEANQTNKNSLDGSVILAHSITATKIEVSDLVAFGATIGGFNITNSSIYSGVKSSVSNTTRGIYLDTDGQMVFGDSTNFVKFFKDTDNAYKLSITANNITLGTSNVETSINNAMTAASNAGIAASNAQTTANTANSNAAAAQSSANAAQSAANNANTNATNAAKTATNYMNLNSSDGLVIGDLTAGTLGGNVQIKAETGGASIALRNGTSNLAKFIATSKAYSGVTAATTSTANETEITEDDTGSTSQAVTAASQTVSNNQTKTVVRFDSANPIYFSSGISTDSIFINNNGIISNADFTLNGRLFDRNGMSVLEPITGEGNLSIGYGRFKNATSSSSDFTIVYGNKVSISTKKGARITQDGSAALETVNSNGNMVIGYHLTKRTSGNLHLYAKDDINLYSKNTTIRDSTGSSCFEARNENGNTVIGWARYTNANGNTNIYGGQEINLQCISGGNVVANSSIVPGRNAALALGKAGELGWSNIYIGNASGAYNGLRIILDGVNENLCGRDENGRFIFGNNGSVMHYRAKDVGPSATGNAFRITSGNDEAGNSTSSVWLFGAADSTSRYVGSYLTYSRTYSSAANMHVTANGVFGRSTSSSQRYKRDISIAPLSELSGLYNLPVKKYKYNDGYLCDEDELCDCYLYGFITEDLVDILPCAVEHIDDGTGNMIPEMWNINIIVPAMMKLIQDLNSRLAAVEENSHFLVQPE